MANPIDIVISKEALAEIDKAISKVGALDKEIQSTAQSFITNSKKMASALSSITPVDVSESIADNSKLTAELERQAVIIKGMTAQIEALKKARATNNKLTAEEIVQRRITTQNAIQEAKLISDLVGKYDKLSLQHQRAVKDAQNMGAQYGVTSDKFLKAAEKANKLDTELKTLDATLGKHNRNVGNYASGYNALGNSINQLTREAPAFVNSINTGFMALSNNFPALFDAINGIREQNKALAAEGKPTQSVFKQLAGAVFSWQTLLSVGVTLLTLYGGQLIKWVGEMTKGKEVVSDLKLRMQSLNKAFEEGGVKDAVTNVNELTINIGLAKKGFIDKEKVVKQYNESIGKTTGLVASVDEAEKALVKNGDAYIKMMLYKAAANLALEEATKATLEAEKSRRKSLEEFSSAFLDADISQTRSKEQYDAKQRNIETQRKKRQDEEVKINQEAANKNINIAKKFQEDAAKIAKDMNFNFFSDTKEDKTKTKSERAKKEAIELKSVADTISQINAKIAELQEKAIVGEGKSLLGMTNKEIAEYKEKNAVVISQAKQDLSDLIKLKTTLNALPTASTTILQPVKKEDVDNLKAMSEEMKAYMANFTSDFINQSGFTNTFKILNDEIDGFGENASVTFNAIAESAQEMFNFISNASQANSDAEYARLESQYNFSIKAAGNNAEAKKKIEEDYEKKKKEIANRENKAKQKQAIFNIAIDTAQAIVGLWAKPGFPQALPLAIAVGALGAAQIGMVAAQKIPQYFDGGVHGGGLAMINDAGGSNYVETVVTPDGKVQQFKGRDVITDLPKGTEIFTPEQWASKELEYMLNSRGVMLSNQASKGFTAEQMDAILAKHFGKIQTNTTVFDKKGIMQFSEMNGNKTIRNANRATGLGFKV